MNTNKLRELIATIRAEMAMGITAQRLAVLTVDALSTFAEDQVDTRIGHTRPDRAREAMMREMAVYLLEDLERQTFARTDLSAGREQKLATITSSYRSLLRQLTGST